MGAFRHRQRVPPRGQPWGGNGGDRLRDRFTRHHLLTRRFAPPPRPVGHGRLDRLRKHGQGTGHLDDVTLLPLTQQGRRWPLEFAWIVLLAELPGQVVISSRRRWGGLPRAPHFAAWCHAGRRRGTSSGLSFGVNAGLKLPNSDVRSGRPPHNLGVVRTTGELRRSATAVIVSVIEQQRSRRLLWSKGKSWAGQGPT